MVRLNNVSDPGSEWRRMDRGPKHGIINDSYGVHEEEIIMFEMNGTKVSYSVSNKVPQAQFTFQLCFKQIMTQTQNESKVERKINQDCTEVNANIAKQLTVFIIRPTSSPIVTSISGLKSLSGR